MPPKKIELTTTVKDLDHFLHFFNERNPKLVVIDLYPSWSGQCDAMMPFYKNLQTNVIDEFEKRIDIIHVDQDKIESLDIPELKTKSSRPKFILAHEGKIFFTTDGPNTSQLEDQIKKNVPYI